MTHSDTIVKEYAEGHKDKLVRRASQPGVRDLGAFVRLCGHEYTIIASSAVWVWLDRPLETQVPALAQMVHTGQFYSPFF
jgi:hypothetical protein